jgi:hypothetical protein
MADLSTTTQSRTCCQPELSSPFTATDHIAALSTHHSSDELLYVGYYAPSCRYFDVGTLTAAPVHADDCANPSFSVAMDMTTYNPVPWLDMHIKGLYIY